MRRPATVAIAVAAAVGSTVAAVAVRVPDAPARKPVAAQPLPVSSFDLKTFAQTAAAVSQAPPRPEPNARAALVPHHWLAAPLIVGGIRDLAASRRIQRVLLLGPNHSGAGGHPVTISMRPWSSPWGVVDVDEAALSALARAGAVASDDVMQNEHSVAGLVPAVAGLIPGAAVVAVAVAANVPAAGLDALTAVIAGLLRDPGTVLVASVDFSHGRTFAEARRANAEMIAALSAGDTRRIARWGNEHLDSPETLVVAISAAAAAGASRFSLRADSDSTAFGAAPTPPNITSYLSGLWN